MTSPPQDQIDALVNLYFSGQMTKTEQACIELLRIYPESFVAFNILGAVLQGQGKLREAIENYEKAILLKPDYAMAYNNRGNALKKLGRVEEAVKSYEKAILLQPDYADAYHSRGVALKDLGRVEAAVESYEKAIQLKPGFAMAYNNRGVALEELGRVEEAVKSYEKAIQLKPDYALAYSNRGNALKELGRVEEELESYEKAIQLKPDFALAYNNLCEFYEKHNMVAELEHTLHQAQAALPKNDPYLLYHMAQLATREKRFEDAREFLELMNPEALPLQIRSYYTELLAKTYDKLGKFDKAFTQFEIANKLVKQSSKAKRVKEQLYFNRVSELSKSWSSVTKITWPDVQAPNPHSLAFLVGFPRSGTTLLDTILMSHSEVSVCEEKPMVDAMQDLIGGPATPDLLAGLNIVQLSELRKAYYDELSTHIEIDGSYNVIIDKHPLNIIQTALIHRVFPGAKFILVLRHPYDCVLSCFMQYFKLNDAMANFLSLEQSARLYDAVMSLWFSYNNALDLDVGIVKYEELILDLQGTVEPLLKFLNLDWHDDLLDYQQTALSRGKISTPSYNQVTQKLYAQASGRWKNYRDQIKGILPLLAPWAERFGYSVESS